MSISHIPSPTNTPATPIPSGFARSADGAANAAVAYVLAGSTLMSMASDDRASAINQMAAEASAGAQLADVETKVAGLQRLLHPGEGPTRYMQAVLAVRVVTFDLNGARVSVWSVGVLSRVGVAEPQAGWSTSTLDLAWERDDWKLRSEQITPGPTPALNRSDHPTSAVELEARLDGFVPVGLAT